ncbi:glycosyltransferase [Methanothermococcus sp. SCGC AD-155-M21]|nr:glycosyltransferase [Methanothermococcus sp. SCGC AD-155-M21]
MLKKKKAITVLGTVWNFATPIKITDKLFESIFISFYEPWIREDGVDVKKIVKFNEEVKGNLLIKPFKILMRNIKLYKIIKSYKSDIVISHHDDANIPIIPLLLLHKYILKSNIRFYGFMRAGMSEYDTNNTYYNIVFFFIKYFYNYFDKIITVSYGNKKLIEKRFSLKNVGVIYNAVDVQNYLKLSEEPIEDKYREIFKDSFVFINIGRLTEQKGQWFLIRAFKKVVETHSNAKLIILGEGELRKELEDLIRKLNLENKVFLVGVHKNPFKFLKNSQCLVFTSLWESFGNVLVEALTLNLPIISTDCETGPREILTSEIDIKEKINYPYFGRYGILIKPFPRKYIFKDLEEKILIEQEKQLAELMIKIIENKELRKNYSHGLERARDFDIDKIIKKWEEVIK